MQFTKFLCVINLINNFKLFCFKRLVYPVAVYCACTGLFEFSFIGCLEFFRVNKDMLGIFSGNNNYSVRVSKNNVAGVDADSAAGNRNVDFARTFLVGAAGCCSGAVNGEISFSYLVNVAYRAVKDYSCDFFLKVQISHHYFTHKGAC